MALAACSSPVSSLQQQYWTEHDLWGRGSSLPRASPGLSLFQEFAALRRKQGTARLPLRCALHSSRATSLRLTQFERCRPRVAGELLLPVGGRVTRVSSRVTSTGRTADEAARTLQGRDPLCAQPLLAPVHTCVGRPLRVADISPPPSLSLVGVTFGSPPHPQFCYVLGLKYAEYKLACSLGCGDK
ncbi:hypothetical protein NDU88_007243 [Pleurodeles waltl]|uniref:Uncharacterized protein n=1 Tax=Pleurodeles waltl TaxID=8319 RepID=A0AAV7VS24_PLEWA|nr:hypothetical protein NDU88_007243 [Pleurodeles waltl]